MTYAHTYARSGLGYEALQKTRTPKQNSRICITERGPRALEADSLESFSEVCLWKDFLGNIRGVTLWNVSLGCVSEELLWGVSLEGFSAEYQRDAIWRVSLESVSGQIF